MILIYVTAKDESEAKTIGKSLLKKKLIACANYFPIESMYWSQAKLDSSQEYVLLLKTADSKYDAVAEAVKEMHSYSVPCIMKLEVASVNREYSDWVDKSLK